MHRIDCEKCNVSVTPVATAPDIGGAEITGAQPLGGGEQSRGASRDGFDA